MGDATQERGRGAALVAAVGVGVGIAVAGLTYSLLAIPLYVFAQTDPDGLDRPLIRRAFFNVAVPAGLLVGLAAGVVVGLWYHRGGRLPDDDAR